MAITSAAGPVSNLVMAFVTMILEKICLYVQYFQGSNFILGTLSDVFYIMTVVNISLAIFNLIPVPPLDGSRILNLFLPERIYFAIMKYEMFIFIGLFLLLWSGILSTPLSILNSLVYNVFNYLTGFVDLIARMFL